MSIFDHILSAPHSASDFPFHPLPSLCLLLPRSRREREREATLQCRHSNNLSPSDQLVWARIWVADPAASHKRRLIMGWNGGVRVPERLTEEIRGAERQKNWRWRKKRNGQNEEERKICVNKTESPPPPPAPPLHGNTPVPFTSLTITGRSESYHCSSSYSSVGWDPPARPAPLARGPPSAEPCSGLGCVAGTHKPGCWVRAWRGEAGARGPSRGCWGCILLGLASATAVVLHTPWGRWVLRPPCGARASPGGSWGKHTLLQTSWTGPWASLCLLFPVCSGRRSAGAACRSLGPPRRVSHHLLAGTVWWSGKRRGACGRVTPDPQSHPPGTSGWCPTLRSWSQTVAGLCVSAGVCALGWGGTRGRALLTSPSHWAWQRGFPHLESRGAPHPPGVLRWAQSLPSRRRYWAGLFHVVGLRTGRCSRDDDWQACGPWSSTQRGQRAPPRWWTQRPQMPQASWGKQGSLVQSVNFAEEFLKIKRHNYGDDI